MFLAVFFFCSWIQSKTPHYICWHILLASTLVTVPHSVLVFHDLCIQQFLFLFFYGIMFLILGLSDAFSCLARGVHFQEEYHRSHAAPFSVHSGRECLMTMYLITGDTNLDHLVKVVSAGFPTVELVFFPL